MRKTQFNFLKKISPSTLLAVFLIFFLSACQKDSMQEMETQLVEDTLTEKIVTENLTPTDGEAIELTIDPSELKESATSRSATVLKYQRVFSIGAGQWKHLYYTRPTLPDPSIWKVEVEIRPVSGDPDLYIYGYDTDKANPWRKVRESTNAGLNTDKTSFRKTGMKGDEERMYLSVKGYTATTYEIFIYWTTVDCVEYPSADQWVTLEYNPVCGCNGVEYANPSSAMVSGVTSWTVGACGMGITNGLWRNVDVNTRGITKFKIKNSGNTIQVYGSCQPNDCDWGDKTLTFDGTYYRTTYEFGFVTSYIRLYQQPDGRMRLSQRDDFHDGRTDKSYTYYFR